MREVAHPQLFRSMLKDKPALYFPRLSGPPAKSALYFPLLKWPTRPKMWLLVYGHSDERPATHDSQGWQVDKFYLNVILILTESMRISLQRTTKSRIPWSMDISPTGSFGFL
jgi:hypothetical protein